MNCNRRLIDFVRAGPVVDEIIKPKKDEISGFNKLKDGDEIKAFYDEVVGSKAETSHECMPQNEINVVSTKSKLRQTCVDMQRMQQKLLLHAQNGNLSKMKELFETGIIDIDSADVFNWTALMCAVCSGSLSVVEYLVSSGANIHLRNNQNLTAVDLARKSNRKSIVQFFEQLDNKHNEISQINDFDVIESKIAESFYCDTCKSEFTECRKTQHERSTLHLFNTKKFVETKTMYHLSENNKGFQLMIKSGWNQNVGLGPEGKGKKYPIKTVLKQDRKGLGVKSSSLKKAKVTHFGPHDTASVKSKRKPRETRAATLSKRSRTYREQRDRQWEIKLRTYMNSD